MYETNLFDSKTQFGLFCKFKTQFNVNILNLKNRNCYFGILFIENITFL